MKKILVFLVVLLSSISCYCKELKYPTFTISDSLKQNAWAVVRNQSTFVEVISLTKTRTEITKAVTVLNKNGKKLAWGNFSYDNDRKIIKVDVNLYNSMGVKVDHWDKGDLKDVSYDPYGTTFTDTRLLSAKPISNSYPYTVEYHLIYEQNNTYISLDWNPVWSNNLSIEKSSYKVTHPDNFKLMLDERNLDSRITKSSKLNQKEWTLCNYMALKHEAYSPAPEEYLPQISIIPANFSYDNYEGSLNSWNEMGRFFFDLNEGRNILPPEKISEIKRIADTCPTEQIKVKCLYEYMQSHTRYISIQVGIGGFQPIPAEKVAETGYGDCKALSNYMMTILKYADIKSYYTLIEAGSYKYYFDTSFVKDVFNHIILCVPLKNDTVWLECTSQTMPYGFLGDFTDNRYALLITENGGVLAKTPKYSKLQNHIDRKGYVAIGENGNCTASLVSEYRGLEYDDMHHLSIEDKEEQEKMLYKNYDIPNFKINSFNLNSRNNREPILKEKLELELISYASLSGTRIFVPLNLASKSTYVPSETIERKLSIHKRFAGSYSDTITYTIPENYSVESLPNILTIDNKYGKYFAKVIEDENEFVYIRNYEINSGIYAPEEYDAFIDFFKDIRRFDGSMVVLKRN